MNFSEHKHVVVIYPHPDDESFGTAGTITKFREAGVPVTYLCGTLGEMGRNMGNPFFANRETLPQIRKQELIDACNVLDMNLEMLGYRDKTIEFESRDDLAERFKNYLEDLGATLVITFYPGYAVHPDHNAMGAAAFEAVKRMSLEKRPEVWATAFSNDRIENIGKPNVVIDILDVFDTKLDAIKSHRSQVEGMLNQLLSHSEADNERDAALERFRYEGFYDVNIDEVDY
ncbi:bacillithiol biosynthesis deacetylase BshB2 [Tenuibacillus multivorans]|uniref:Bacillithiol biosynthesis deacetylase BshB2 n=1 Tax=Tenuibacillus multivorans TaxID=237069 RepID=A0A1H0DJG4_9BACI|nr:bacillithiol biosynthesis deacetylase BshB2 [Tenuibacillus multivorans]GEL76525.1 putative N-acetyl-alpha-D-glucosaminyl L-malate deacetylase 2 [Tenuibacillus multivorans]SDN70310.1 bacillithiol biosynthesis deacetylase BshB2 [Tenuibacillus multivorans]